MYFRYWPKAEVLVALMDVCFQGQSGHRKLKPPCPLMTKADMAGARLRCNERHNSRSRNVIRSLILDAVPRRGRSHEVFWPLLQQIL
jgi:hypothetical protein